MKKLITLAALLLGLATPAVACDHYVRKYNEATTVDFCLWETDGTDFKTDAVAADGDVTVMKDEGDDANITAATEFSDEGLCYSLALTATEMSARRVMVRIIDQSSKVWLDKCLIIETFGSSSGQFDTAEVDVTKISGDGTAADNLEAFFDDTATAELSACPTGTAPFRDMIKYIYEVMRNKLEQTASAYRIKKDNGTDNLCTATVGKSGGTTTRGELQ